MPSISKLFIACSTVSLLAACSHTAGYEHWTQYKGGNENIQYSSLKQVDTNNVNSLKPIWEYHTGDADTINNSQIQCNPIIIDGTLYGTSPKMKLFAIDAATGKEKWQFNPYDSVAGNRLYFILNNCRGITFWSDGKKDRRIYYTAGAFLYAINATDGKPVNSFGKNGKLDLHEGLGENFNELFVTATSPGIVYKDLLIMGTRVNESPQAAPGHIRAYDIRTGQQRWIFKTIPGPGDEGYESWDNPEAYKYTGGANAWGGFSLDLPNGILFACTGSSNYDWYGGRRKGNNLFANCLLALDAATGKKRWHFQELHHDVWDRDLPSAPALVTINKDGNKTEAVALTTKTGFVYVLERTTGKPVYDIVEKPVPVNSDLEGEQLSPTQPQPVKPAPFMRQLFTEKDINPLLPDSSYQEVKKRWLSYRRDNMYNPPSLQGTIEFPGLDGGAEWGGPAYDPETGILYVNANEMAWVIQAAPVQTKAVANETISQAGERLYKINCMSCHGPDRKGTGNFPSLLNIHQKYNAASMDTLVQTGRRMMPAFKNIPPAEREAIISFVLNDNKKGAVSYKGPAQQADDPFKLPYTIIGYNKFMSTGGLPAISPPWGTLNAIDLNTGEYVWKKPLGHDYDFPIDKGPTGTENYGAPVVTAGGLVFIAASKDGYMRAFHKLTGKVLWEYKLPNAAYATPAIFKLNGKQILVIACGGGKMKTKSGDSYLAFAL